MRTLTFASIKGGVGKTTLATHVAAGIADRGLRTLLVDLDPQGHASTMLGVEASRDDPCVADAFGARPRKTLADVVVPTARSGLSLAPANVRMVDLERELFRWGHRLRAIPRALETLAQPFDALVIDTPPQLNAYTEAALAVGDVVVVPVGTLAHSLQGLDEICAAWEDAADATTAAMVGVINLWDKRTTATNAAMEDIFVELPVPLAETRVPRTEALNQAGLGFQMVYEYAPASAASTALQRLTGELLKWAAPGGVQRCA